MEPDSSLRFTTKEQGATFTWFPSSLDLSTDIFHLPQEVLKFTTSQNLFQQFQATKKKLSEEGHSFKELIGEKICIFLTLGKQGMLSDFIDTWCYGKKKKNNISDERS